jgi:O-antigen biosynthesis protein WbqV
LAILAHDLAAAAAAIALALIIRYHFEAKPFPPRLMARSVVDFVLICAFVFPIFRLHRGLWRYTAANDLVRIVEAVVAANLLLLPALFLQNRLLDFPRSTPIILAPLLIGLLAFGRILAEARARGDLLQAFRFVDRSKAPAVVVASPAAAAAFLKTRTRERIVGVVTLESPTDVGRTVQGAEILGDLSRLTPILIAVAAQEDRAPLVVLAEPSPPRGLTQRVIAAAAEAGALVASVRGDTRLRPHPVAAADLLDRPARTLDLEAPRRLLAGKRVLVTGAGGTIGGELTRQVLKFGPERVILLDASEFNLYAIDRELSEGGYDRVWSTELGDVRDIRRLETLFAREAPHVVLHAAALKHVPLMELNPCEAVLTNVVGAVNVARAARDVAESLVFISTDKAVNPTNVMGATKRVAEQALQALARGYPVRASAVRFGNVLGSTGSVVPLFERQIAAGGPLTVTDPAIERYFMTVEEAAALVLQAASLPREADGGSIFVLDMGDPVRIDDLARQMIRLHGLRPDEDVKIVYTGLRPGEKLYEEVFYGAETVSPTAADGVLCAVEVLPAWEALEPQIESLARAAERRDDGEAIARLRALVPAFRRG